MLFPIFGGYAVSLEEVALVGRWVEGKLFAVKPRYAELRLIDHSLQVIRKKQGCVIIDIVLDKPSLC